MIRNTSEMVEAAKNLKLMSMSPYKCRACFEPAEIFANKDSWCERCWKWLGYWGEEKDYMILGGEWPGNETCIGMLKTPELLGQYLHATGVISSIKQDYYGK